MKRLVLASPNCADLKIAGARELEIKNFPDGENYVRVSVDCSGKDVILVHRCYPNIDSGLIQLFLALHEIKEERPARVRAVIPYLPYARQDKRFLERDAVSSKIICSMLARGGCDELITFDCHFLKRAGEFEYAGLKIKNLTMGEELLAHAKQFCKNPLVISPDEGARYLVEKEEGARVMKKERGAYVKRGATTFREANMVGEFSDVSGRDVIIIDDMVASGGTMLKAARACRERGARSIVCCATHGLFLGEAHRKLFKEGAKKVISSNTILHETAVVDITKKLEAVL